MSNPFKPKDNPFVPLYDPTYGWDNKNISWDQADTYFEDYCMSYKFKGEAGSNRALKCKSWADQMASKNKGISPESKSCFIQLLSYFEKLIEYKIFGKGTEPEEPGWVCMITGGFALINTLGLIAIIFYFGSSVLTQLEWFFGKIFGVGGSFVNWTSSITGRVATFLSSQESVLFTGFKYFFDLALIVANYIIESTDVNIYLLELNVVTFFAWMATWIITDIVIFEEDFETSGVRKIYRVFDWPYRTIREVIEWLSNGKDIIYWITSFFLLPFDCGSLVISYIVYGVLYLLTELLDVITNKSVNTKKK